MRTRILTTEIDKREATITVLHRERQGYERRHQSENRENTTASAETMQSMCFRKRWQKNKIITKECLRLSMEKEKEWPDSSESKF
jgi:ATP-dependent protease HslVU (ClpYQ) ATPase subunit